MRWAASVAPAAPPPRAFTGGGATAPCVLPCHARKSLDIADWAPRSPLPPPVCTACSSPLTVLKQGGQTQECSLKSLVSFPWDSASRYSLRLSLHAEKVTYFCGGFKLMKWRRHDQSSRELRGWPVLGLPRLYTCVHVHAPVRGEVGLLPGSSAARLMHLLAMHSLVCVPAASKVLLALVGDVSDAPVEGSRVQ